MVVAVLVDRAVVDEQTVGVDERAVADLPDLLGGEVAREDALDDRAGVRAR